MKRWIAPALVAGGLAYAISQENRMKKGIGWGRRGTRYDASEWIYFFSAPGVPTDEAKRLRPIFTERIEYLLDNVFLIPTDPSYPDLDNLAYLSYASIVGHGVGLWEDREPWHSRFEKVVEADTKATDLAHRLDHEFSIAREEAEEGEANRGRRSARGRKASSRGRRDGVNPGVRRDVQAKYPHLKGHQPRVRYTYFDGHIVYLFGEDGLLLGWGKLMDKVRVPNSQSVDGLGVIEGGVDTTPRLWPSRSPRQSNAQNSESLRRHRVLAQGEVPS